MKVRRGICYWPTFAEARAVCARVEENFPDARVVSYSVGFAVQFKRSGSYVGRAICCVCGSALSDSECERLDSDIDFVEHGSPAHLIWRVA